MVIKEKYNCMLLGDSISKGVIYDDERKRYVNLKENYTSLIENKINLNIYNASRFGNTITKGIERLDNDVVKSHPDIVVIEFGGNDCDFNWEEVASSPDESHNPNTDFDIFKKSLHNLINRLREEGMFPVVFSIPPIDSDRYFDWISKNDEKKASGILKWLGTKNKIYWWQERYNSALIEASVETDTPWVDIRSAFLQQPDYRELLCSDGIHPNPDGHKVIASRIMDFISKKYSFLLKDDLQPLTN